MKEKFEVDIQWVAFPLHPETPPEGRTLGELFAGRPVDIDSMMSHLRHVADQEGLPFGPRNMTYNSRMAQELGKWAEAEGAGEQFHNAAFSAYFQHGRNIAALSVLKDLARTSDLDPEEAARVLTLRTFKDAVDEDWRLSRQVGVTAVPTFMLDDRFLVGYQPYSKLEKLMRERRVAPKAK